MNWRGLIGRTVYLDSNIFIYALEAGSPYGRTLGELIQSIEAGAVAALTSEITIAGVLTRPCALGSVDHIKGYEAAFSGGMAVGIVPVSRAILLEAARVRGSTGLKLVDAIHVGTATLSGCDVILSNDADLIRRCPPVVDRLLLSEVTA